MLTEHFNGLTEAEAERLTILAEECAEVIQAATKILRHGYASNNLGKLALNNRQQLAVELSHILWSVNLMAINNDIHINEIEGMAIITHPEKQPYFHHNNISE